VIDKGQVVEQGTHDELLHLNGVYKKLVLRQLMTGKDNAKESDDVQCEDVSTTVPDVD
jgi:hypothetical protein